MDGESGDVPLSAESETRVTAVDMTAGVLHGFVRVQTTSITQSTQTVRSRKKHIKEKKIKTLECSDFFPDSVEERARFTRLIINAEENSGGGWR